VTFVPFSAAARQVPNAQDIIRPLTFGATSVRVQGADRLGTSVAVSQYGWETSEWVVLATARNFPDALVGDPLAAALGAPLLLAEPDGLPAEVGAEIQRLGASHVVILGGTAALSDSVIDDIIALGLDADAIERIGGKDRYETAEQVAARLAEVTGGSGEFILATGLKYPDALAVSGFAGANGFPILLSRRDSLPVATVEAIEQMGAFKTLIVAARTPSRRTLHPSCRILRA
jgi:putative cell wall-binding protein